MSIYNSQLESKMMEPENLGWRRMDHCYLTSSSAQSMKATSVDWILAVPHISEDDRIIEWSF